MSELMEAYHIIPLGYSADFNGGWTAESINTKNMHSILFLLSYGAVTGAGAAALTVKSGASDGTQTTVRDQMKDLYSGLEEAKADVGGVHLVPAAPQHESPWLGFAGPRRRNAGQPRPLGRLGTGTPSLHRSYAPPMSSTATAGQPASRAAAPAECRDDLLRGDPMLPRAAQRMIRWQDAPRAPATHQFGDRSVDASAYSTLSNP